MCGSPCPGPLALQMAPKASKAKGKDKKPQSKGKVDDQSDDEPTQPPPMKKPKKEPIEDKEDIIGEKKDLDKLNQAMKYQAKKGNPHPHTSTAN